MTPIIGEVLGGAPAPSSPRRHHTASEQDFDIDDDLTVAAGTPERRRARPPGAPAPWPRRLRPAPAVSQAIARAPAMAPGDRRLAAASFATGLGRSKLPARPRRTPRRCAYTRQSTPNLDDETGFGGAPAAPPRRRRRRPATTATWCRSPCAAASGTPPPQLRQRRRRGGRMAVIDSLDVVAGAELFAGRRPCPASCGSRRPPSPPGPTCSRTTQARKYHFTSGRAQPCVGGDLVLAQYARAAWAVGGRAPGAWT
ncbi:MAG: hypothetical protein R3F59_26500 [Myxococcota bacterium]